MTIKKLVKALFNLFDPTPAIEKMEEARHEIAPLHSIMWAAEALKHPGDPRAKYLIEIGVAQAARYYLDNNDLGLLLVSGMTREQFEHQMGEMVGLPVQDWHKWKNKELANP
jgi:hypothetical protein